MMKPHRPGLFSLFLSFCAIVAAAPVCAQEDTPPPTAIAQDPDLDKSAVQARIDAVENDSSLEEATKTTVLENLRAALRDLESAEQYQERTAAYRQSIVEDPAAASAIRSELGEAMEAVAPRIADDLTAEEARAKEQSKLDAAEDELERQKAVVQALQERPAAAREEQTAATEDLEQTETDLQVDPVEGTPELIVESRHTRLVAHQHALSRQILMLEQEQLSHAMRLELAEARRDQMERRVGQLEQSVAVFDQAVSLARAAEARAAEQRAQAELEAAADQHPIVQGAASTNTALSKELTDAIALQDPAKTAKDLAQNQLTWVEQMHQRVRSQLEGRGLRGLSGGVLRDQRSKLEEVLADLRASKALWNNRSTQADGRLLALYLMQSNLADLDQAAAEGLIDADPPLEGADRDRAEVELRKLLETRHGLVLSLDKVYRDLLTNLNDLESSQSGLEREVADFTSLLDEWLLWMPSTTAPDGELSSRFLAGIEWLTLPSRWQRVGEALLASIRDHWPLALLAVILLSSLLVLRRRARARLETISEEIRRISTDRIGLTLEALGLVILLASPLPFLLFSVSVALRTSNGTNAIGEGLLNAAVVALFIGFLILLCSSRGVGDLHFKWRSSTTRALKRNLSWVRWPLILAMFLVSATEAQSNEDVRNGLGRVAFVAGTLVLLIFWQRVLRPSGELMKPILDRRSQSWLNRLRWVWYPGALAVVLALGILAILGYYYTALELDNCLFGTIVLIAGVVLIRAIAVRWLLIEQRRMAVERFQAQREAGPRTDTVAGEEGVIALPDDSEIDLTAVNEQTRKLIGTTSTLTLLVGAWAIWAGVLPALAVLDSVRLWTHTTVDATGAEIPGWTTLQDMVLAILALFLTVTATRNLPGLLQVVVLKNLPMEPSTRYAIVSVIRYCLTIVGTIVVFQILGFKWSSVQWLVAALGVGIGFGLQEIIANFICGLILLFERPVRIGDYVTIGDSSGTVTRIRIRATTITDWDQKEMVIPNKELITGRVLNWTLSSKLNRAVVAVGVAYGTDTERVRELLVEVAKSHPKVIDDPAPLATFEGFGDSTLNFVLRAYLADYDGRLNTLSELHTAVDEAFKAADIEISFPQLDLHVRSTEKQVVIPGQPPSPSPAPEERKGTPV